MLSSLLSPRAIYPDSVTFSTTATGKLGYLSGTLWKVPVSRYSLAHSYSSLPCLV